ncbi:MAG: DUF402 domain-containing protein [Chloroflexota bacterium]
MALPATRIRGIYATALTRLCAEQGAPIANPSPIIESRLRLAPTQQAAAVQIADRRDRQGVTLDGAETVVAALIDVLQTTFPRAVVRPEYDGRRYWSVEFPASVKDELDLIRREVLPTVYQHHHLKTIDSRAVDVAEADLEASPDQLDAVSTWLRAQMVERHFISNERIVVEHVKPAGQWYDLGGHLASFDGRYLQLNRRFSPGGLYDSLDVPRLQGDYGRLDIEVGSGICVRRYFRANGLHLGDLYNLATEAELYPGRVRYIDLELDVLHMPGEAPRIVDEDDLERAHRRGFLSDTLVKDAWKLAQQVLETLNS